MCYFVRILYTHSNTMRKILYNGLYQNETLPSKFKLNIVFHDKELHNVVFLQSREIPEYQRYASTLFISN